MEIISILLKYKEIVGKEKNFNCNIIKVIIVILFIYMIKNCQYQFYIDYIIDRMRKIETD